jgi:hypothetical protein
MIGKKEKLCHNDKQQKGNDRAGLGMKIFFDS